MGDKWEVWAWIKNPDPSLPGIGYGQAWHHTPVPCRQSLVGALWAAMKARRTITSYVRIEWR